MSAIIVKLNERYYLVLYIKTFNEPLQSALDVTLWKIQYFSLFDSNSAGTEVCKY